MSTAFGFVVFPVKKTAPAPNTIDVRIPVRILLFKIWRKYRMLLTDLKNRVPELRQRLEKLGRYL
jgi:hypothetical protein